MSTTTRPLAPLGSALFASTLLVSCAPPPAALPAGVQPDVYLLEQGQLALEDRDWFDARQNFQQLLDSFPQSVHRQAAKIGVGDAHFGEDSVASYVRAKTEYLEFLTFYPSHENAGYAQYRIGMSEFNQMRRPERDQSKTREAIEEFEVFFERYPNNALMPEVQAKYREAKDRLSQSEYLIGYFYFKQRWYPGAIIRFLAIMKKDPDFGGRDAVYFYMAEAFYLNQRHAEALPYYERIITEFEESEFLATAWDRVRELKVDDTEPDH